MSRKNLGGILAVIGVVVALVCGLADVLGIGSDLNTFGSNQMFGVAVGVGLLIVGLVMRRGG